MQKKIFIGFFSTLLIAVLALQISSLHAHAEVDPLTSPVTPPITSEETPTMTPTETPTVTPPVTSPEHKPKSDIFGKVTYERLGRLWFGANRIIPAPNVLIKVVGFFNHHKHYETTTDSDGKYRLDVPPGLYEVFATDGSHTFFVPPLRVVSVGRHHPSRADFKGLKFVGFPFGH